MTWSQTTCSLYPFLQKGECEGKTIRFRNVQEHCQNKHGNKASRNSCVHCTRSILHFFSFIPFNFSFLLRSSPAKNMGRNAMFTRFGWRCSQSTLRNVPLLMSHQSSCCTTKLSMVSNPNFVQTIKWTTLFKNAWTTYSLIFPIFLFLFFFFLSFLIFWFFCILFVLMPDFLFIIESRHQTKIWRSYQQNRFVAWWYSTSTFWRNRE